jgi:iron(III) transport system ATP-binding protein
MVAVENLRKQYGNLKVLDGVSCELSPGEILAVIGPSGSGKTTFLRIVAGFEKPDGGRVCIDDVEVSSPSAMVPPHRRKLAMVFQDLALWPHMTVWEHLKFVIKKDGMTKSDSKREIDRILEDVHLESFHSRYPHQLSGGEKQRLAIGRALASFPAYLLMDEPFSHLDPRLKEELLKLLLDLNRQTTMGVIYVTHNLREALTVAKSVAMMDQGCLVRIEETESLWKQQANGPVQDYLKFA